MFKRTDNSSFQPIKIETNDINLLKQSINKVIQIEDQYKVLHNVKRQLDVSKHLNHLNYIDEPHKTHDTSNKTSALFNTVKKFSSEKENLNFFENDNPLADMTKLDETIMKKLPKNTLSFLLPVLIAQENTSNENIHFKHSVKFKKNESNYDIFIKPPSPNRELDNTKSNELSVKINREHSNFMLVKPKIKIGTVNTKKRLYPESFKVKCSRTSNTQNGKFQFKEKISKANSIRDSSRLYNDYMVLEVKLKNYLNTLIFYFFSKLDLVVMVLCLNV